MHDNNEQRKVYFGKACDAAGAKYDFDSESPVERYLAIYRDEGEYEVGHFLAMFDSLQALRKYHTRGQFAVDANDPDSKYDPVWMLREVHDLDEQYEIAFTLSLEFLDERVSELDRYQVERNERTYAANILDLWGDDEDGPHTVLDLSRDELEQIAQEAFNLATSVKSRNEDK